MAINLVNAAVTDITRQRMYLETMERVLGPADKIVIDSGANGASGVLPYLPLNELTARRPAPPAANQGGATR